MVFFIESVATTTLLSAFVYLDQASRQYCAALEYVDVGVCSRCLDIALQQTGYCHLSDGLCACGLIPLDLVDADVVLAVTCGCESRHFCVKDGRCLSDCWEEEKSKREAGERELSEMMVRQVSRGRHAKVTS